MNARLKEICSRKADWAARNRDSIPQIMGEFSPAFTDCAVWLNGRGAGARYDGTLGNPNSYKGDCGPKRVPAKQFTADYKRLLARYWQIQREGKPLGIGSSLTNCRAHLAFTFLLAISSGRGRFGLDCMDLENLRQLS